MDERVSFGRADDGADVRIEIRGDAELDRDSWWPSMGLEPVGVGERVEHTVRVDTSDPNWRDRLESDLGLFAAERLAGLVAVHAGVIVIDGAVIVVPGTSFSGKSTLCAAALDAGYEVWSDEYALVDPTDGSVRGYPRRIRLRLDGGGSARRPVSPSGVARVPALVAKLEFDRDRSEPVVLEDMSQGDVVMSLIANTVCASSRPNEAFDAAIAVARACPGVRARRGAASEAIDALARAVRRGAGEPERAGRLLK